MQKLLFFVFVTLGVAQTIPTLSAVNIVAGATLSCSFEAQDSVGSLFVQCKDISTGNILYTTTLSASDDGAIAGYGQIMCLYWTESIGKFRLQCGDGLTVKLDGYIPVVVRKKRWYLFWR